MNVLQIIYCGVQRPHSTVEVVAGHGHDRAAIVAEHGPIFSFADGVEQPAVELWLVPDPSVRHVPEVPHSSEAAGLYCWHWRVPHDHPQAQPFTAFFDGAWPLDKGYS